MPWEGKRRGDPPPPSLDGPSGFAGNDPRDYKTDRTSRWVISRWPLVKTNYSKSLKNLKRISHFIVSQGYCESRDIYL